VRVSTPKKVVLPTYLAIDIERENSKAAGIITRLRQVSMDQLQPPPTEQVV
jgi:hypothetical protein